jgi:hypothetical protein
MYSRLNEFLHGFALAHFQELLTPLVTDFSAVHRQEWRHRPFDGSADA